MTSEVLVAALSLIGTLIGSISGVLMSAKLTIYRIQQLEKKVDMHNNFATRIPLIEKEVEILDDEVREIKRS